MTGAAAAASSVAPPSVSPGPNGRGAAVFVALAYGLMWLFTVPLWLSGRGLATPGAPVILAGAMLTPALASLVVCRRLERRPWTSAVGLGPVGPGPHRARRTFGWLVFAALIVPAVLAVATALSWALGVAHLDLVGLSGVAAYLQALPGSPAIPRSCSCSSS